MQEQNFFQKTNRYFSPIFDNKIISLKAFCIYSIWGISPLIHIVFIQQIVEKLEMGLRQDFLQIVVLYVLYNVFYEVIDFSLKKWGWVETVNAYRNTIDSEYITKFIQVNNNDVEKQGTGKLVSIITNGSDTWALGLDLCILEITRIFYIFAFSCYMFFSVSPLYGMFFIVLYTAVIVIGSKLNDKSLAGRRVRMKLWNNYVKSYVRILMSKVEIMQSSRIKSEIAGINSIGNSMTQVNKDMAIWVYGCYRIAESSVIWAKIAILVFIGLGVIDGIYSLAFFVGVFAVMALMEASVKGSMKFFRNFTKDFTKIEQLWNFFDTTPQIQGYDTGETFVYKKGQISLKNISYGYDENKKVFTDFSLNIPGNKITALVGPSGGGKSTLVKLISGYITPDSGDIIIDGQKLSEVSLKSYYQDVGYLTQEPSVFDGTIIENLLYAVPSLQLSPSGRESESHFGENVVSFLPLGENGMRAQKGLNQSFDSHLQNILKLAHCEFIYNLPNGLDTEIGERGIKLSGGQKQRLAIAKIFLKDPKIIILDEPTSALDSQSEQKITQAMHNLFSGRTVLIIAHRLQTVKHADTIIVVDSGKIVESGTHTSLVRKKGYYKQMLDLQSGF